MSLDDELSILNGSESFPYPVTVSREDFQQGSLDQHDVDEFLYKNHRFTSIESLIKDLTQLSTSLSQELLDLVNDDYDDFIELGKSIDGGLELINSIKVDLTNFNQDLHKTQRNFKISNELITNGLSHKKKLNLLKTKVKLLILLNDQINNFENLLNLEVESANAVHKLRNLTSLYLSLLKINNLFDHDNHVEISLHNKVSSLKFEYKAYLDNLLQKSLTDRLNHKKIIMELLNIYKIIGHETDFISITTKK